MVLNTELDNCRNKFVKTKKLSRRQKNDNVTSPAKMLIADERSTLNYNNYVKKCVLFLVAESEQPFFGSNSSYCQNISLKLSIFFTKWKAQFYISVARPSHQKKWLYFSVQDRTHLISEKKSAKCWRWKCCKQLLQQNWLNIYNSAESQLRRTNTELKKAHLTTL